MRPAEQSCLEELMSQHRAQLLGKSFDCVCGRRHSVPTHEVLLGRGVLGELPALCERRLPNGCIGLVADRRTWPIAGERIESLLTGRELRRLIVDEDEPCADSETLAAVTERAHGCAALISLGAGTINDLAKGASTKLGIPYISVATAASMNGYTSSIVALLEGGLKTTRPAQPAVAVVADLDILCAAPLRLTRAGLGDVVSKPVCNADWVLARELTGAHFCPRPFELIKELEEVYLGQAAGLARQEEGPIAALSEALIYSGISMVIAGSSAPASGAEHLISHTIDMRAILEGHEHDLHGTQVGVGTSFMVRLYKKAMSLSASDLGSAALVDRERRARELQEDWGRSAPAVIEQALAQVDADGMPKLNPTEIKARWPALKEALEPYLKGAEQIESALEAAGGASHYQDLGLDKAGFRRQVLRAPDIRDRVTLFHVLRACGVFESCVDAVLDEWQP